MVERGQQASRTPSGGEGVTVRPVAIDPAVGPQDFGRLFGDRLKAGRQERGLSQAGLSRATDVTAAYISLIERGGANPTLETMLKLSEGVELMVWQMIAPDSVIRNNDSGSLSDPIDPDPAAPSPSCAMDASASPPG